MRYFCVDTVTLLAMVSRSLDTNQAEFSIFGYISHHLFNMFWSF